MHINNKDGGLEVEAVEVSAKFLDRLSEALGRISWYDDSDNRLTAEEMADRLIARVARARAAENREEMARFGPTQPASTALVEALEPFSRAAGELFARNWNASQVVMSFSTEDGIVQLTARDFFAARSALSASTSRKVE